MKRDNKVAVRAVAGGAVALGTLAVGSIAIGIVVLRRLNIMQARLETVEIGRLHVKTLIVDDIIKGRES